jgi:hypothetical protein
MTTAGFRLFVLILEAAEAPRRFFLTEGRVTLRWRELT